MTIPFRFRTVRFGATVLLFITMGQLAHAQSDLDVFIGPRMERDEDLGRSLGSDDELFYTLRTVEEKKGRTGFIDGWSRETLSKVFSTPLEVPVVNAEVFSVHEVIVGDRGLQLFYSFHSREDGRVVLAMAALDQQGRMVGDAQELIEVPAAKKRTTQRFIVNHDNRSGMTLILNTDLVHPDNILRLVRTGHAGDHDGWRGKRACEQPPYHRHHGALHVSRLHRGWQWERVPARVPLQREKG
ncbi:MAG: hypothetical protein IPO05_08585 [Flavobacteriales bacterium]|nr:hypothetical protein [Flavobacteriales bacterium]